MARSKTFHKRLICFIIILLWVSSFSFALQPNQILIIANSEVPASVRIARHYCQKRNVPLEHILAFPLGNSLDDTISREDYKNKLATPIRGKLYSPEFTGKIRCLLTTYGVPFKVGPRGVLKDREQRLNQLTKQLEQEKKKITLLEQSTSPDNQKKLAAQKKKSETIITRLQSAIDYITGKETNASVDSELSMVLFGEYELYRWQPNKLKYKMPYWDFKSLMVSRLDGPDEKIARDLVDRALIGEKNGLSGSVYIDSGYSNLKGNKNLYTEYDQSLLNLAAMMKTKTKMPVVEERTVELFTQDQCPRTAVYCGWYSVKKYVDAFSFVNGAIGFHIASFEAVDLRNPNSTQWCPAMLKDGITATLGSVTEPYLHSFPKPDAFFSELLEGSCLVEAYYRTKPFNSWQLLIIGDPLYRPFPRSNGPLLLDPTAKQCTKTNAPNNHTNTPNADEHPQ